MNPSISTTDFLLPLCLWREARNQGPEAWRAIYHVIVNRARSRKLSVADVILQPEQFTSMTNKGDTQTVLFPVASKKADFAAWLAIINFLHTYDLSSEDPTHGAQYYFTTEIKRPAWSENMVQTAAIGKHLFFKE